MKPIRKRFSRPFRNEPTSEGVLSIALFMGSILTARILTDETQTLPKSVDLTWTFEMELGDFTMLALFLLGLAFLVACAHDSCKKADQK